MSLVFANGANGATPAPMAFEAVVEIATSLRGNGDALGNFSQLRKLLQADRAAILRIEDGRARQVCVSDRTAGEFMSDRQPQRFAELVLQASEYRLLPGKVLFLSALLADGYSEMLDDARDLMARASIRDVAIVVLEMRDTGCDVIEFQFGSSVRAATEALLASMSPAIALAWSRRLPGSAHALMRRTRARPAPQAASQERMDILGPDNPANLSRSEFRICAMIREGMMTKSIAEALGIRPTTLRSHLHSIYSKTGTSCHVDLLHRLSSTAGSRDSAVKPMRAGLH